MLGPVYGKAKKKDKKAPSRQSTLFGLPLGPPLTDKRNRKKGTKDDNSQPPDDDGNSRTHTPTPESVAGSSTQASESDTAIAGGPSVPTSTLVETQLNDEIEVRNESQDDTQDHMDDIVRVLHIL